MEQETDPNILKEHSPSRINIVPDDYHARFVGKTKDLKQFFITTPFESFHAKTRKSYEFIAVFIWDEKGKFLEAKIDNLGSRETIDEEKREKIFIKRLEELDILKITIINIEPFEVEKFDVKFGLIYSRWLIDDFGEKKTYETVELHPGNYMAFHPPWDGHYDT